MSMLLSFIKSSTAKSFILAIRFLWLCIVGINERGHVGVYLINGLEKGTPDSFAYPTACAVPESGTPATISGLTLSLFAIAAPQRYLICSTFTPSYEDDGYP